MRIEFIRFFGKEKGDELEKRVYAKTYHFASNKHVPLNWTNSVFVNIYYNNCMNIIDNYKNKSLSSDKAVGARLEELDPHFKRYVRHVTPLSPPKTVDFYCPKCRKITKNFAKSAQLRSADEAKTNSYTCECGHHYCE